MALGESVVERDELERMNRTLIHRGPDAEGVYVSGPIGLAQRRLSVIDLRDCANPPLSNEDGTVWVVFNGEIYNFAQLREELEAKGHRFRTSADTEVLPHLYEDSGLDFVPRLHGMFAFALWDSRRRILVAARDRLGKKPFYYARTPSCFVFGSEIKAVLADPAISAEADPAAIDEYLRWQYVPSPRSAFRGIRKLPAAHVLICSERGDVETRRYWTMETVPSQRGTPEELRRELASKLRNAVRRRLVSDVPLGAWLSGGIDSSLVVALMAEELGRPVRTFTIGFDEPSLDERKYARLTSSRFGTEHHELLVKPDALDLLPKLVYHYNEPFADSSAIPTFLLSEFTRRSVTVALSGDGGDEAFAGYRNYRFVMGLSRFDVIPRPLRKLIGGVGAAVSRSGGYSATVTRAATGMRMIGSDFTDRFRLQTSVFKPHERWHILTSDFRRAADEARSADEVVLPVLNARDHDPLGWMTRQDLSRYLPDCLLVKTDIASMAHGLEVRSPILDHEVVEFALGLQPDLKFVDGTGKVILRQVASDILPPELLDKPKTGFRAPIRRWFQNCDNELLRDLLLSGQTARRGVIRPAAVRRLVNAQNEGTRDSSDRLWALAFLEQWYRTFVD